MHKFIARLHGGPLDGETRELEGLPPAELVAPDGSRYQVEPGDYSRGEGEVPYRFVESTPTG